MPYANQTYLEELLRELQSYPRETEWLEFKQSFYDHEDIAEYISALSNSATIAHVPRGYMVWGIEDGTKNIVGTKFLPSREKVGNEELEHWLSHMLTPRTSIRFHEFSVHGKQIVILEIPKAIGSPVQFRKTEFFRYGSHKHKLTEYPNQARKLWAALDDISFEQDTAAANLTPDDSLKALNYSAYFYHYERPIPSKAENIVQALIDEGIITKSENGKYNISNLGAVLYADNLSFFKGIKRKAPRVIHYRGNTKFESLHEEMFTKGYAVSFNEIIRYVKMIIPSSEVIGESGIRTETYMFPELAVREIIANALIHQDFSISGTGVTVELFDNRLVVTNPGRPIVNIDRLIDTPPKSRNEEMAALLRRIGVCEERGSGFDKIIYELERNQFPPPEIRVVDEHFVVTLFAKKSFTDLTRNERLYGCYLHACLQYVNQHALTNTSLRERYGIEVKNSSIISRLIKEAIDEDLIKPVDPSTAPRYMKYIPTWG